MFNRSVNSIRSDLSYTFFRSYVAKCITYSEYQELLDYMRSKLSWENLLGIKQYSFFDQLDDEKLVETMTAPEE